jgi:hypothetical protein
MSSFVTEITKWLVVYHLEYVIARIGRKVGDLSKWIFLVFFVVGVALLWIQIRLYIVINNTNKTESNPDLQKKLGSRSTIRFPEYNRLNESGSTTVRGVDYDTRHQKDFAYTFSSPLPYPSFDILEYENW